VHQRGMERSKWAHQKTAQMRLGHITTNPSLATAKSQPVGSSLRGLATTRPSGSTARIGNLFFTFSVAYLRLLRTHYSNTVRLYAALLVSLPVCLPSSAQSKDERTFIRAQRPFSLQQEKAAASSLRFAGSLPQIASAGGWDTSLTLVNLGTDQGEMQLNFFANDGNSLSLPFTFPQQPSSGASYASSFDQVVNPGATLILDTTGPALESTWTGSSQVLTNENIGASAIFTNTASGQSAVVPLETRNAGSFLVAFDNTRSVSTGVAIANVSASTASVNVTIRNDAGVLIGAGSISLAANGHTSFMLTDRTQGFPVTAGMRGTVEFNAPSGGQISVLGLRANAITNGSGFALTTLPVLMRAGLAGGTLAHLASGGGYQTEARWPNGNDVFNVNWATAQAGTTASQLVDSNLPAIDWSGAKVHLWSGIDPWSNQTGTVTASQAGQITLSLDDACLSTYICPAPGGYYYLFGVLGALDAEQEWYYDSTASTLYFWAPGGVNPNTLNVRAKQRQYAFDLSGVSNVTIRNIGVFASAINMNSSSANNVLDSLNVQYVSHFTALPAAVGSFTNAHFTDSGIIINGTGNTLQNSTVAYSAGAGVAVVGSSNSLRNNLIHHTGYIGNYASGISLQAGANTIRNNTVHTNGRFALYLCGWTSCDNDEIGYNNLFNGMILTHDGGEIYATATVSGVRIDHNWIHDTQLHGADPPSTQFTGGIEGVDLDNHASGYEVDQNVLWNNQVDNTGISGMGLTTPDNNNIHNNTIPDVGSGAEISLGAIQNCGTTQVADTLVLVAVDQSVEMNTPCPANDNGPAPPGATDMNASVQVGCDLPGCQSEGPPAIVGNLVAASIAIQPADVTVIAGQTATFTVLGEGSPPLSYQWQRNGVNIRGAISATYTTPATSAADNGALFAVQVSNSVGSVTSDAATLIVR